MGELGDVLGDDFEEQYESKVQQRRQKAQRVTSDTMMKIAHLAINEGGFKGEEPRFTYDEGDIQHDVLLMQAPEKDIQKFRHQLGDSAVSLGMFHLDKLFSCAFNEGLVELVDKIEEGKYYLVVGRYQQKTEMKDGEERTYNNMSPVRGIAPISKAKEMAQQYDDEMAGTSVEEQAEEQSSDSSSDDSSSGGVSINSSDDDSEVDRSDIVRVFQAVADGSSEVLREVAAGNSDALSKLTNVVNDNVSGDEVSIERVADIFEEEVDEIDGRHEEEEEEEDDGIDLGGLGGGDSDDGDDSDDEEEEVEETTSTDDSSGDEEEGDPDDWF